MKTYYGLRLNLLDFKLSVIPLQNHADLTYNLQDKPIIINIIKNLKFSFNKVKKPQQNEPEVPDTY